MLTLPVASTCVSTVMLIEVPLAIIPSSDTVKLILDSTLLTLIN